MHKSIKQIQVDGNPLKSIRRAIIDKGSQGVLKYLMDKYVEGTDDKVEQWALDQDKKDKEQLEEYNAVNAKALQEKEDAQKQEIIEAIKEPVVEEQK